MSDVKKCPHCGGKLHGSAMYCMYCMTSLEKKRDITPAVPKRKKWIAAVVLLAVVMILVVIGLLVQFSMWLAKLDITYEKPQEEDSGETAAGMQTEYTTEDLAETQESTQPTQHTEEPTEPSVSTEPTEFTAPTDPEEPEQTSPTVPVSTEPVCSHFYQAATCIAPMTCEKCGDTQGQTDDTAHIWKPVTAVIHHEEKGHYYPVKEESEYL